MTNMVNGFIERHRPDTEYISASEYQAMDNALEDAGFYTFSGDVQKMFLDRMWMAIEASLPNSLSLEERNARTTEFYYYYYNKLDYLLQ